MCLDESQGQGNNVSFSICNNSGNLHSCIDVGKFALRFYKDLLVICVLSRFLDEN